MGSPPQDNEFVSDAFTQDDDVINEEDFKKEMELLSAETEQAAAGNKEGRCRYVMLLRSPPLRVW